MAGVNLLTFQSKQELKEAEDREISKLKEMLKPTVKHEKDDLKTNLKA